MTQVQLRARPVRKRRSPPMIPILFFACLLRLAACFNAFWFDEIWSWEISQQVHSAWQILTNPLAWSDNNHPLNTLWMYLVGDTSQWLDYRVPSLVCGIALLLLVVWMERKTWRAGGILACLFVGLSFPLITYSSEARGYMPMLLCAVAGYYLLREYLNQPRAAIGWGFAVISCIGPLWHLTYVHFLLAAFVWCAIVLFKREKPLKAISSLAILFALPLLVLAGYAWIFLRHVHIGGNPNVSAISTITSTLSLLIGGTIAGVAAQLCAVVAAVILILAFIWLARRALDQAVFFLTAIVAVPVLTIIGQSFFPNASPSIQVRYLLVSLTFGLILLVRFGSWLIARGGIRRNICIAMTGLIMLGNGYELGRFLAVGRGDYRAAVVHLAEKTSSPTITWSTDNPGNAYRIRTLLAYYDRFLPPGKHTRESTAPSINPPQWLIYNVLHEPSGPLPPIHLDHATYVHDSTYPAYGLSGWTWVIYRRHAPGAASTDRPAWLAPTDSTARHKSQGVPKLN